MRDVETTQLSRYEMRIESRLGDMNERAAEGEVSQIGSDKVSHRKNQKGNYHITREFRYFEAEKLTARQPLTVLSTARSLKASQRRFPEDA